MANLALAFDILAKDKASKEFDKVAKSADSAGEKGKKFGKAMAVGIGAAVGIIAGAGKALYEVGKTFDDVSDTIRVGTGATGKALKDLEQSAKNIGKNVPAEFADIGTAVADLNTRLGLTGKPLEDMSAQFLNLSRITKTDVAANIESLTRVFGDWGVAAEDQADSLDAVFRASQATGAGVDSLSRQVVQFGAPMRQLGFSFEETLGLLGKFEKEGVNTELVMGSMRIALGKMAKAGEDPVETLGRVTDQIKNAGSAGEANALALEVFGARAGPDMAAAIREGRFELGDLYDTIANGSETINSAAEDTMSFSEQWQLFKNQALVAIEPIASRVFKVLGDGMKWVNDVGVPAFEAFVAQFKAGEGAGGAFADVVTRLKDNATAAFEWIRNNAVPAVQNLVDQFKSGTGTGGELRDIFDQINTAAQAVFKWLRDEGIPALQAIWDFIANTLGPDVATAFNEKIIPAAQAVGEQIERMWEVAGPVLSAMWEFIKNELAPLMVSLYEDGVKPTMELIADAVEIMWAAVKLNFEAVTGALTALVNAFTSAKNGIASAWGGLREAVAGPIRSTITWINDNFISPINSLMEKIGLSWEIPRISVVGRSSGPQSGAAGAGSVGAYAMGGTVAGHSPNDRADNIPAWLTAGEYVLPVAATRSLRSRFGDGFLESLRRGLPGFADGGLVGFVKDVGGHALDWAAAAGSALKDPAGTLAKLVASVVPGGDVFARIATGVLPKIKDAVVAKIKEFIASLIPSGGQGWQQIWSAVQRVAPEAVLTSSVRAGATTAGSGATSMHALGRAIDIVSGDLYGLHRKIAAAFGTSPTELIGPIRSLNISRGTHAFGTVTNPTTLAGHKDHVHIAYGQGGLVKPFVADSGVTLAPGINVLHNKLGKPEPLARTDQPQEIYGTLEIIDGPSGPLAVIRGVRDYVSNDPVRSRMAGLS